MSSSVLRGRSSRKTTSGFTKSTKKLLIRGTSSQRRAQEVQRPEGEVKRLEDAATQHPKKLWAAVENFKKSAEFEGTLSAAVECFKKSPEFLDALGANAAYGVSVLSGSIRRSTLTFALIILRSKRVITLLDSRSSPWMPLPMTRKMKTKPLLLAELPLRT
ncbi:hypothetical protein LIER_03197 [Lithospermum erythrorhizon]|uniref:Uncharacterized protein n=1 Tax=Lithospermum erythrorhizon TaxID=34254 RepID=A0AAV3NS95_LITER